LESAGGIEDLFFTKRAEAIGFVKSTVEVTERNDVAAMV
jgi:hypothetical protein